MRCYRACKKITAGHRESKRGVRVVGVSVPKAPPKRRTDIIQVSGGLTHSRCEARACSRGPATHAARAELALAGATLQMRAEAASSALKDSSAPAESAARIAL